MVAWAQREPGKVYPAWHADQHRLLVRRIDRLNFVHRDLTEGLPPGVMVRRESTKTANDMLVIYVDGQQVERISNMKGDAAGAVAQWIEVYAKEMEVADVTEQGLELLKGLAKAGGTLKRAYAGAHGGVINAAVKKGHVVADSKTVTITEAGIEVLRGLPEFDLPVMGQTSPPPPLLEERGEQRNTVIYVDQNGAPINAERMTVDEFTAAAYEAMDEASREYFDELRGQLVRVVLADGIGLEAVVTACGAEIMAMGGTVIKLEIKEALLRELYPPLVKFLEGLDAIGASYAVFGDLQIVVERPLEHANDPIEWDMANGDIDDHQNARSTVRPVTRG